MLNQYSCKLTRIVTSSIFAATLVATPLFAADNSSWLDQQRAISDGSSFAYGASNAGPEGRPGTVYIGAKLERNTLQENFVERGKRITDGTTE
jgi:hypothetical protein